MPKSILITGGSGLLAINWAMAIRDRFNVILGCHNKIFNLKGVKSKKIFLDNYLKLKQEILLINPEIIIHTAGITNIEFCENNKDIAQKINIDLASNIAKICSELNIILVHISTDHLFSNNNSYFSEEDKTSPLNYYGITKANAEKKVLKNHPKSLVIRTNFFGWGPTHRFSFSDRILISLSLKKKIDLFDDVLFTPILIEELVNIVHELIEQEAYGIYNVSGNSKISKYDFGLKLAKYFNLDENLINAVSIKNKPKLVKRPLDMSLSNKKSVKFLNKEYGDLNQSIKNLFNQKQKNILNELRNPIPYGRHHLDEEDIDSVVSQLKSGSLTQGPIIEKFEDQIAKYVGSKYAVAVSSCSAGLIIAGKAAGLNNDNGMITSSITFVSSANAALHNNSKVYFTDVDEKNINMSIESLENQLKKNPEISTIMPVHFAGFPCNMESIQKLANKNNLKIIEDAAHALGAKYQNGKMVGSCCHSLMTVFSFHPVKSIALGEGGIITTNDEGIYRKLLRLRSHGINKLNDKHLNTKYSKYNNLDNPWYYEMQELGFNFRITDIQCALGLSQLKKINKFIHRREYLAKKYDSEFKNLKNLIPIQPEKNNYSGHHLYVIRLNFEKIKMSKAELMNTLKAIGIGSQVHYIPLPIHPYFQNLGFNIENYPNSKKYYKEALSIPLYYDLTDEKHDYIINIFKDYIG